MTLFALHNRIRILSTPKVVATADKVVQTILQTYQASHKTFGDLPETMASEILDPFREFSDACREELRSKALSQDQGPHTSDGADRANNGRIAHAGALFAGRLVIPKALGRHLLWDVGL